MDLNGSGRWMDLLGWDGAWICWVGTEAGFDWVGTEDGFDLVRGRLTNPYRFRACDGCSPLVGLVIITVLYHGAILARPRP